jgi:hypothetical protein
VLPEEDAFAAAPGSTAAAASGLSAGGAGGTSIADAAGAPDGRAHPPAIGAAAAAIATSSASAQARRVEAGVVTSLKRRGARGDSAYFPVRRRAALVASVRTASYVSAPSAARVRLGRGGDGRCHATRRPMARSANDTSASDAPHRR